MEDYSLDELALRTGFDRRVIRSFIEQGLLRGPVTLGRYARYSRGHLIRLLAIKALRDSRNLQLADIRKMLMVMTEEQVNQLARQAEAGSPAEPPVGSALDYIRAIRTPSTSVYEESNPVQFSLQKMQPSTISRENSSTRKKDPGDQRDDGLNGTHATDCGEPDIAGLPDLPLKAVAAERISNSSNAAGAPGGAVDEHDEAAHKPQSSTDLNLAQMIRLMVSDKLTSPAAEEVAKSALESQRRLDQEIVAAGGTPIDHLFLEISKLVDTTRIRRQARGESWYRIAVTPDIEIGVRGIDNAEQLLRLERIADCLREILLGRPTK